MLTQFRFLVWSVALSVLATPAIAASEVPPLGEGDRPATSVEEWVSQIQQSESTNQAIIEITNVSINPTETGVEIVLETAGGELLQPATQVLGNALIADIPNASIAQSFEQAEPTAGIAFVEVIGLPGDRVRIAITGVDAPPTVEISTNAQQLILSAVAGSEGDAVVQEDAINVITTATRTEEELQDVPRSVTVIEREQIEEQSRFSRNLVDILGQLVPGFSQPSNRLTQPTLRGRQPSVVIDGIPQDTNNALTFTVPLASIDPDAIERIEIVRGPNAIFGGQATGGVINIITRRPSQDLTLQTQVGLENSLTHGEDSFGYILEQSISGTAGRFDGVASLAFVSRGATFDAEGDRVANNFGFDDTDRLNGFIRAGVQFDELQRLDLTFNYSDINQDTDFISDESTFDIPGIQTGRLIRIPEGTQVIGSDEGFFLTTTNATLSYTNEDLFGSEVAAQVYFRDYSTGGGIPFDDRLFGGTTISSSRGETEQWGGRLQIETPFNADETISLLWGVDYVNETIFQNFELFDPEEFDESNRRIYRKIGEAVFLPEYEFSDLGIFAQLQADVGDLLTLSGGARYVNITASADDYTTFDDDRNIEGGTIRDDDVVFNLGAVYDLSDRVSVFASFSQGFSFPDIGRILRRPDPSFTSIEDDLDLTSPQRVDSYELGVRGIWDDLQVSLAGFFNYSALGVDLAVLPGATYRTIRAPRRVYGIEATIDWQPSDLWLLGSTISWQEGENDEDRDGDFLALDSLTIAPLKITAYLENQTTPGWRNRLQFLYSGNRDRAFEDGIDGAAIEEYLTVDFLSSIDLFGGELILGIQNLLNTDYFPVFSQYYGPVYDPLNYAAPGRSFSLTYRITW
jgi:iron complex outermembrane receptor protein